MADMETMVVCLAFETSPDRFIDVFVSFSSWKAIVLGTCCIGNLFSWSCLGCSETVLKQSLDLSGTDSSGSR